MRSIVSVTLLMLLVSCASDNKKSTNSEPANKAPSSANAKPAANAELPHQEDMASEVAELIGDLRSSLKDKKEPKYFRANWNQLRVGMPRTDVLVLLGVPDSFQGNNTNTWRYHIGTVDTGTVSLDVTDAVSGWRAPNQMWLR